MNTIKQLNKRGWQFVGIAVLLSAIPYFFIIKDQSIESEWALLLMWMPALAGIIMRLVHKEGLFKGIIWNPFKGFKWILIAAAVPFVIEIITILMTIGLDAAMLKDEFLSINDGMIKLKGMALLFGAGEQPWYIFIPNYLLSYFVGVIFYSLFFAFGEEFGWRGYLQKHWAPKNDTKAFLLIGLIWGLWHLPGILLGHNFPEYPIVGGLLLMPLVTSIFSICFGSAFNKTNVIWVPAIFHGAVNISAEISNVAFIEDSINNYINDTIWIGLWIVVGVYFWNKFTRPIAKD